MALQKHRDLVNAVLRTRWRHYSKPVRIKVKIAQNVSVVFTEGYMTEFGLQSYWASILARCILNQSVTEVRNNVTC
jgi:hypothetical protein